MREDSIAKIAALYAKEIAVAKANSSDVSPCEASGKHMAKFYTELFKGITSKLSSQRLTKPWRPQAEQQLLL